MRNNTLKLLALSFLGLSLFSDYASGMNEKKENRFMGKSIAELRGELPSVSSPEEGKLFFAALKAQETKGGEAAAGVNSLYGQYLNHKKKGFKGKGVTNSSSSSKKEQHKEEKKDDNKGSGDDEQPAELSATLKSLAEGKAVTKVDDVRELFFSGNNQTNLDELNEKFYVQKGEAANGGGKAKADQDKIAKTELKKDAIFGVYGTEGSLKDKLVASFKLFAACNEEDLTDKEKEVSWFFKGVGQDIDEMEQSYELFAAFLKGYMKD